MEEALLWFWRLLPIAKSGICTRWSVNWTRPQHHAIPSATLLVAQRFVLMYNNDPKYSSKLFQRYIKAKSNEYVLQLMSWPAQSTDLNSVEQVLDGLEWKVKANQPTRAFHIWQLLPENWEELSSVHFQSWVERMPRICKAVILAKEGNFDKAKVLVFYVFSFNLYLMWLVKTSILI